MKQDKVLSGMDALLEKAWDADDHAAVLTELRNTGQFTEERIQKWQKGEGPDGAVDAAYSDEYFKYRMRWILDFAASSIALDEGFPCVTLRVQLNKNTLFEEHEIEIVEMASGDYDVEEYR